MEERHFAILRRHMVEVIEIYVELAREDLGKMALDERVLAAMGRVPRHAFVPTPWQGTPMPTCPCRSASTRPSPNPSWWPS